MSTRKDTNYTPQISISQRTTATSCSGPQGVIRTAHRQRPSPLNIPHRTIPDQYPFGPQIPLQVGTRGRHPTSHIVPAAAPKDSLATAPAPVLTFLDSTFRTYAERIQVEFTQLRSACTKIMFRERQERDKWRSHCVTFKQERDDARERVRLMLKERESLRGVESVLNSNNGEGSLGARDSGSPSSRKRRKISSSSSSFPALSSSDTENVERQSSPHATSSSTTAVTSDVDPLLEEEEAGAHSRLYPSPRTLDFPPFSLSLSLVSPSSRPHKRSRSADPVLCSSSPNDVKMVATSGGPELPYLSAPVTHSPRRFSESTAHDLKLPPILSQQHCGSSNHPKPASSPVFSSAPLSITAESRGGIPAPSLSPQSRQTPLVSPTATSFLDADGVHLDIMYLPQAGKLECRVCKMLKSKSPTSPTTASRPISLSFAPDSKCEVLRDHCVREHPKECADVARLKPAELYELRRIIYGSKFSSS